MFEAWESNQHGSMLHLMGVLHVLQANHVTEIPVCPISILVIGAIGYTFTLTYF